MDNFDEMDLESLLELREINASENQNNIESNELQKDTFTPDDIAIAYEVESINAKYNNCISLTQKVLLFKTLNPNQFKSNEAKERLAVLEKNVIHEIRSASNITGKLIGINFKRIICLILGLSILVFGVLSIIGSGFSIIKIIIAFVGIFFLDIVTGYGDEIRSLKSQKDEVDALNIKIQNNHIVFL